MMYLITAQQAEGRAGEERSDASPSRFRVVLVTPPSGPPEPGAQGLWELPAEQLPAAVYLTDDRAGAEGVAARLRALGAEAAVVAGWSGAEFCGFHDAEYTHGRCRVCDQPICRRCAAEARGHRVCPEHHREDSRRRRRLRVRQLFSLFLFSVFLFVIGEHFLEEQRVTADPPVEVGIFQFAPPGVRNHPTIHEMNRVATRGRRPAGLRAIKAWYDAEYQRFTGSNREYLRLHLEGPWTAEVTPPGLAEAGDGAAALTWRSFSYARYWLSLARRFGVDPRDYGARIYVVYRHGGAADLAAHSLGSAKGRMAVVNIDLEDDNPAYAALTLAHELGHVLGATDKYHADSFYSAWPEGYVEPYLEPVYPQRYAELMAVDRPLAFDVEAEVTSLDQLRVGHRTAAEMRWIQPAQADYFYLREGADPGDRLSAATEQEDAAR